MNNDKSLGRWWFNILSNTSNSACIMKKLVSPRCKWLHCQPLNLSINGKSQIHKADCVTFCKENLCGFIAKLCSIDGEWRSIMTKSTAVQCNFIPNDTNDLIWCCRDINERQHMCLLYDKPTLKLLLMLFIYLMVRVFCQRHK